MQMQHVRHRLRPVPEHLEDRTAPTTIPMTRTAHTIPVNGRVILRQGVTSVNVAVVD
jgi:hypothetical protein